MFCVSSRFVWGSSSALVVLGIGWCHFHHYADIFKTAGFRGETSNTALSRSKTHVGEEARE